MTALLDCSRSWATRTGTKSLKFSVDSERARPELPAEVAHRLARPAEKQSRRC